jgi:hypothetical protein
MTRKFSLGCLALSVLWGWTTPLNAAAVAHWSFDNQVGDKGVYPDTVGNAHPATPDNKDQVKLFDGDAPFGKAATFDGPLNCPSIPVIQKGSFTVAAWIRPTQPGLNPVMSDWTKGGEYSFFFGLDFPRGTQKNCLVTEMRGEPRVGSNGKKTQPQVVRYHPQDKEVPVNEWHHVAWVWKRTTPDTAVMTIYLDGEEVGSKGQQTTPLDLRFTPQHTIRIGGQVERNVVYHGAMDELWVFNEALPADQIKNLMRYNNTAGTGNLAKVLVVKDQPAVASADNPDKATDAAKPTDTPKSADVSKPADTSPPIAAVPNPPKPETAVVAAGPTVTPDDHSTAVQAATPDVSPKPAPTTPTTPAVSNSTPVSPPKPAAIAESNGDEDNASPTKVSAGPTPLAAIPIGYSPARLAGIIASFSLSAFLAGFLLWAMGERAKLRAHQAA